MAVAARVVTVPAVAAVAACCAHPTAVGTEPVLASRRISYII